MENGKGIEALVLPEEAIQHVQSFMTGKEAARTTVLSKSWHAAWLTRPTVDLDDRNFRPTVELHDRNFFRNRPQEWRDVFEEFASDTMRRYQDSSFKIERFNLHSLESSDLHHPHHLIVNAIKSGATHLQLKLSRLFTLPKEVLGSKTLLRLAVSGCQIDGDYAVSCSRLKSLSLYYVRIRSSETFKDIMISCRDSLEELSLSLICCGLTGLALSPENLHELHNLRRLVLKHLYVETVFFTDFAARFPCLKDLTVHDCYDNTTKVHIASTSLQTISFKSVGSHAIPCLAEFDVPNIRKFVYLGGFPSINGASKECEFKISISCHHLSEDQDLKEKLTKLRQSRIYLSINILDYGSHLNPNHELCTETIVVEKLKIRKHSPPCSCSAFVLRLLGICRPKFITHYFRHTVTTDDDLYKKLMHKPITSNCGIPDQEIFGKFGLKRVNLEVFGEFDDDNGWRRPVKTQNNYTQKVRFELIWED